MLKRTLASFGLFILMAAQAHAQETVSFYISGGLFTTHGGNVPIPMYPEGILPIDVEGPVGDGFHAMMKVSDESGEVIGIAAEIEYFPEGGGVGKFWDAYWTIFIPGRGSIMGYEIETQDPVEFPATMEMLSDPEWTGSIERSMASGPTDDGWGVIVGGTGEWEGATGTFAEIISFSQEAPDSERQQMMEIRFILD